jgi:hypothetical protein
MKKIVLLSVLLLAAQNAQAFQCNECHSKNPAMVKMHKALQGRDCFACHRMGEKLMGKGIPKDKAAQLKRRATEAQCLECHKK